MKEYKKARCRGLGCMLREGCKNWKPNTALKKGDLFMIEEYSPAHGCRNHKPIKIESVISKSRTL